MKIYKVTDTSTGLSLRIEAPTRHSAIDQLCRHWHGIPCDTLEKRSHFRAEEERLPEIDLDRIYAETAVENKNQ